MILDIGRPIVTWSALASGDFGTPSASGTLTRNPTDVPAFVRGQQRQETATGSWIKYTAPASATCDVTVTIPSASQASAIELTGIALTVHIENIATLSTTGDGAAFWIELGHTGSTQRALAKIPTSTLRTGVNELFLTLQDFDKYNASDAAAVVNLKGIFDEVRFRLVSNGTGASNIWISDLRYTRRQKPMVIIGADDFLTSWYEYAVPILERYRLPSVAYVITRAFNASGVYDPTTDSIEGAAGAALIAGERIGSYEQLQDAFRRGVEICNHTSNHMVASTGRTEVQLTAAYRQAAQWIVNNGLSRNNSHLHCAYPGGDTTAATALSAAMTNVGMLSGRLAGTSGAEGYLSRRRNGHYPPNIFRLGSTAPSFANTAIFNPAGTDAGGYSELRWRNQIYETIQRNGLMEWMFHGIIPGDNNGAYSNFPYSNNGTLRTTEGSFRRICAFLGELNGVDIDVVTKTQWYSQWVSKINGAQVPGASFRYDWTA